MKHLFFLLLIILTANFSFAQGTKKDISPKILNQEKAETSKLTSDPHHFYLTITDTAFNYLISALRTSSKLTGAQIEELNEYLLKNLHSMQITDTLKK
jgi:hypothetical protein